MGLDDKAKHGAEKAAGKAKEMAGDVTDNEKLEAEGRSQQSKADAKRAGDHVRDAAKNAKDAFKG